MKSKYNTIKEHNNRVQRNKKRNGKIFIGGLVIGSFLTLFALAILLDPNHLIF